jgi:phosphohistidine phosphatase
MRHAKSSWKDPSLVYVERQLNGRGRKAADLMGSQLRTRKAIPDLILCSSAVRARETIEILLKSAELRPDLRYDERIYEATPGRLLEVISEVEGDKKTVMLVGHNPGMEEFVQLLTGQVVRMPTAALARIALKSSKWSEVTEYSGTLKWLVKPKELADES